MTPLYRCMFSIGHQSNITTIDTLEGCLDWLTGWVKRLDTSKQPIVNLSLAEVTPMIADLLVR